MKRVSVPNFSSPSIITRQYRSFRGLDYSADESQIDGSRSPLAVNMISDAGGWPQKRLGWRVLRRYTGRINGIYPYRKDDGTIELIVHAGAAIYRDAESPVKLRDSLKDDYSTSFYMANKLYILTGAQYLVYDGSSVKNVSDDAYTPTTRYGMKPTGSGTAYEKVNLLSPWRYNKFTGDGESKVYQLDVKDLDDGKTVTVKVDGTELKTGDFSVDYKAGKITFDTAPKKPANGLDNVEIKFCKTSKLKDSTEKAESLILNCTICTTYGVSTEDRVFVTGNPKHPATEYYSGLGDPSYFPDINFVEVGSADWPILNYLKFQGDLVIVKEHNAQEYTVWHQSGELLSGVAAFPLRPGVAGIGAVAKRGAQQLLDDAMFLTPRGVFARVNSVALAKVEQGVKCRSNRINRDILSRTDLKDAVSVVWDGYFILCFPATGECFVADSNQPQSNGGYEWYYWKNIPARVFAQETGVLWFGTSDGRLCRLNNDVTDKEGNIQMDAYNDDGQPIEWVWATKMDDFGNLGMYKNLTKRGCVIQFKTAVQSSCDIYLRTEKDFGVKKRSESLRQLDFEQLDFEKWTFNTLPNNIRSLKSKVKKFQQLQVILRGKELDEAFGVLEIVLRATAGNPVK
ncbi:hypothetical protein [Butyricicoccus pullicaecorum]|uniref:hypothetical protein n=1 Tax=Butyricicoccus pullicaecorum TaxID=501571 RepID=UPI0035229501